MTNRRQFIHAGLAVSAASLTLPHTLQSAPAAAETGSLPLELFIYDERFAEAVTAARVASTRNLRIASTTRVLTDLWYDELDLRWRQAPMTLGGMTTEHGLFVFETLALDRGMRVISRTASVPADRAPDANGSDRLVSWIIGPRPRLEN